MKDFALAIEDQYWFEFFFDDLPVWGLVGILEKEQMYLYLHYQFTITYNQDRVRFGPYLSFCLSFLFGRLFLSKLIKNDQLSWQKMRLSRSLTAFNGRRAIFLSKIVLTSTWMRISSIIKYVRV
jgi:hypothetical protein